MQWYNANWVYRKLLRIPASKIPGAETLENFCLPIMRDHDFGLRDHAQADGDDILFTTNGAVKLSHELVTFVPGDGELLSWGKLPTVICGADHTFYNYYGNPGASSQENPTDVWSEMTAVWHFETDFADATGNGNTGTNTGTVDAAGQIGRGRTFNGTSSFVLVPGGGFNTVEQSLNCAIFASVKPSSLATGRQQIFVKGNTGLEALSLYLNEYGQVVFEFYNATQYTINAVGGTDIRDDNWHRIVGVRDGDTLTVYVDGVDDTMSAEAGSGVFGTTEDVYIGKRLNNDYFYYGDLDELWVAEFSPSVAFVMADYNAVSSPLTFVGFSSEVTGPLTTIIPENAHYVHTLKNLPGESASPVAASKIIPADLQHPITPLAQPQKEEVVPLTLTKGLTPAETLPVNSLGQRAAESLSPVSALLGLSSSETIPVQILRNVFLDANVHTMLLLRLISNESSPIGTVLKLSNDNTLPMDGLQSAFAYEQLQVAVLALLSQNETGVPCNAMQQLRIDDALAIASQHKLGEDVTTLIQSLTGLASSFELPVASYRILVGEHTVPLSIATIVGKDETPQFVALKGIRADEAAGVDILTVTSLTEQSSVVALKKLAANELVYAAALAVAAADSTSPMHGKLTVAQSAEAFLSVLTAVAADVTHPLDGTKEVEYIAVSADRELTLSILAGVSGDETCRITPVGTISGEEAVVVATMLKIMGDQEIPLYIRTGVERIFFADFRTRVIGGELMTTLWKDDPIP